MRNILPWILAVIFLFLAIYFYWQKQEAENKLEILGQEVAEIDRDMEEDRTESMEEMVLPPDTVGMTPPGGAAFVDELGSLSESDIQRLKRKGLQNPEPDLMNDLNRKQSKLIPREGVVGGKMAIRDSRILNDRYALAYYEDGHIGGYMLLKYEVNNGNINWTVVDNSSL